MPFWSYWGWAFGQLPGPGGEGADCARRGRKVAQKWLPPALPGPGGGLWENHFLINVSNGAGRRGGPPARPFQAGNLAKMVRQGRPQQVPN